MRELPDADDIHVLFVARPGGAVASPEEALAHEGSGLFVRPVDVPALVRKVEALAGGPRSPRRCPSSSPPARTRARSTTAAGRVAVAAAREHALDPATPATPVPPATLARPSTRVPSEPPAPRARRSIAPGGRASRRP